MPYIWIHHRDSPRNETCTLIDTNPRDSSEMNGTTGLHPAGSLGYCSYNITTNVSVGRLARPKREALGSLRPPALTLCWWLTLQGDGEYQ